MALTQTQIDSYERDGYLIVREALTAGELAELVDTCDFFARQALELTGDSDVIELDDARHLADGPPLIRRIKSPHTNHETFAKMLAHPGILDVVEDLIGHDIRWMHSKLNAKQPGGGGIGEWHTDWGYYPHTNDSVLEVGIAIDPCTEASGCMLVVPGTHTGRAYDHSQNGRFVGGVRPGEFDPADVVPVELQPGDISLHHVRLLHGSAQNHTKRQRRLLLHGYTAADAWPIMARSQPSDWPEWDAQILRGSPTTHARLEACPVVVPLPDPPAFGLFKLQAQMEESHFAEAAS
ncbi:MAG: phytanoyl-CoA dioxygenase family protein [bacterium]|nr:phytanoyl-CoA dioxygenase family protein [bacterium]